MMSAKEENLTNELSSGSNPNWHHATKTSSRKIEITHPIQVKGRIKEETDKDILTNPKTRGAEVVVELTPSTNLAISLIVAGMKSSWSRWTQGTNLRKDPNPMTKRPQFSYEKKLTEQQQWVSRCPSPCSMSCKHV